MIMIVEDGDLVRSLEDLNFKVPEDVGHRFVHAHGIGVRECKTGLGDPPRFLTISAAAGFRIGLV